MAIPPSSYPSGRETDVVLRDGSTVHVRPIRPDDAARLLELLRGLSAESRALRFFGTTSDSALAAYAERAVAVDYVRRFGLIATVGAAERVVGHACYDATTDSHAEVAFTVADEYQGRGLGTILLGHLAEIAALHGIRVFEAFVLPAAARRTKDNKCLWARLRKQQSSDRSRQHRAAADLLRGTWRRHSRQRPPTGRQ